MPVNHASRRLIKVPIEMLLLLTLRVFGRNGAQLLPHELGDILPVCLIFIRHYQLVILWTEEHIRIRPTVIQINVWWALVLLCKYPAAWVLWLWRIQDWVSLGNIVSLDWLLSLKSGCLQFIIFKSWVFLLGSWTAGRVASTVAMTATVTMIYAELIRKEQCLVSVVIWKLFLSS